MAAVASHTADTCIHLSAKTYGNVVLVRVKDSSGLNIDAIESDVNGINTKDIALLKYKNIQGDYLTFERAKTEKSTRSAIEKSVTTYVARHTFSTGAWIIFSSNGGLIFLYSSWALKLSNHSFWKQCILIINRCF